MSYCYICGGKMMARRMCRKHYYQNYKSGCLPPLENDARSAPLKDRLLAKIERDENGCWLFRGALAANGYGLIWRTNKNVATHRVAYEIFCGPITAEDVICHKCDVRNCVNPDHLFKGTRLDNNRDKVEKGGQPRGETHANSKLSEDDITKILSLRHMTGRAVADLFGVNQSTISRIWGGQRWKHRA